jgi:PAS domain S-box-containing protein
MSYWSLYTLASVFLLIKSTFTAKYRILKKQYGILSAALGLSIFFSLFKALVFPNLFEAESQGGTLSFQLIWLFSILILVDRYRFLLPKKDAERTAILEISGYSLVVIDRQGSIQIMNREAEQLLGIRFNRIASKKINDFLHPFESLRQEMEKMQYKTWQSISSTMVIRTAKGKDIPVDIKVTLLEDKLQRRSGYLLTMKEKSKVTKLQETFRLSRREIEVLQCLVNGFTNQEIAAALFISERTVKTHVTHIFDKLGVDNRVQVIMCLREYEILSTQSSEKEVIIL